MRKMYSEEQIKKLVSENSMTKKEVEEIINEKIEQLNYKITFRATYNDGIPIDFVYSFSPSELIILLNIINNSLEEMGITEKLTKDNFNTIAKPLIEQILQVGLYNKFVELLVSLETYSYNNIVYYALNGQAHFGKIVCYNTISSTISMYGLNMVVDSDFAVSSVELTELF